MNKITILANRDKSGALHKLKKQIPGLNIFEIQDMALSRNALELFVSFSLNSDILNTAIYSIARLSRITIEILDLIGNARGLKIKFDIEYRLLQTTIPISYKLPIDIGYLRLSDAEKGALLEINPSINFHIKQTLNENIKPDRLPITQLKIVSEIDIGAVKMEGVDWSSHSLKVYFKEDYSRESLKSVLSRPNLEYILRLAKKLNVKSADIELQFIWGAAQEEIFSFDYRELACISNLDNRLILTIYN